MGKLQSFLSLLNKAVTQQTHQILAYGHQSCSHKLEEMWSLLTGTAVPNVRSWVSHYQSPQSLYLPFLYFEAFSCTSKALTLQSLIKEIKRNFTRLNQKQIYKIKDCRIRNSGWKGETLKCSMYSKEIQFSLCVLDGDFQVGVIQEDTQIPLKFLGAWDLIALGHFKSLSHAY